MATNAAAKRILREIQEIQADTSCDYTAAPLEDNIFEWHFTIRGGQGTDFEGGIYHGRILLPPDYPFKPPNIVLLTPNGRFEEGVKICLSISAHHPETWQCSWSISTILVALIGFMPTEAKGAAGSLDYPSAERKTLAKKSVHWKCTKCGVHNNTALRNPQLDDNESSTSTTSTSTTSTTTTTTTTTTESPTLDITRDIITPTTNDDDKLKSSFTTPIDENNQLEEEEEKVEKIKNKKENPDSEQLITNNDNNNNIITPVNDIPKTIPNNITSIVHSSPTANLDKLILFVFVVLIALLYKKLFY